MAVLVDTSVWIGALAPGEVRDALQALISADEVVIARPIQAELCQGLRSDDEFSAAWDAMLGYPSLRILDKHWRLSATHFFRCRKRGITPTTLDCLIATLAREYQVPLWSLDRDFERMATVIGFEIARGAPG